MADLADIALCVTSSRAATAASLGGGYAKYDATEAFDRIETRVIDLNTDSPESVAFGDLPSAALIFLHAPGGKVRARLTSADGSQQSVPVDPVHFTISLTVPFTALDLTRVAGSPTVRVYATIGAPPV